VLTISFVWNKNSYSTTLSYESEDSISGTKGVFTLVQLPCLDTTILKKLKTNLAVLNSFQKQTSSEVVFQETYSFETFSGFQSIGSVFILVSYEQPFDPLDPALTTIPAVIGTVSAKGVYASYNDTLGTIIYNNTTGERQLQLVSGLTSN